MGDPRHGPRFGPIEGGIAPRGCKNRLCPLLRRRSGRSDDQARVTDRGCAVLERRHPSPPKPAAVHYFSPTLGTTDEDPACLPSGRGAVARGVLAHRGVKTTELGLIPITKAHEAYTRREPRGWGRCPASLSRRRADEDRARPPRWRARAETVLPGRSGRVRSCGRIGKKWTTRMPSLPGGNPRGPLDRGECPACTSTPWEARPATASEGL